MIGRRVLLGTSTAGAGRFTKLPEDADPIDPSTCGQTGNEQYAISNGYRYEVTRDRQYVIGNKHSNEK